MQVTDSFHAVKNGDKNAFKQLFELFYQGLVMFATKYIDDIHASEDIVQECFISLWNNREKIEDADKIRSILYVSVKNKCLNHIRDLRIRQEHYDRFTSEAGDEVSHETVLIENEVRRMQMKVLEYLSEPGKKVCLMSIDGLKNAEIAKELNISLNTVKYHKAQIKKVLKKHYGKSFSIFIFMVQSLTNVNF